MGKRIRPKRTVPVDPVRELILARVESGSFSFEGISDHLGVQSRALHTTLSQKTIGIKVADRMSVKLGYHPANFWPDEWHEVLANSVAGLDDYDGPVEFQTPYLAERYASLEAKFLSRSAA